MATVKFIPMPHFTEEMKHRFLSRVNRQGQNECWPWNGGTRKNGYGYYSISVNGKTTQFKSHRVSYFLETGADPGDMLVCHSCDNPPCCNPAHHFLGTSKDNSADMAKKFRGVNGTKHWCSTLSENDVFMIREMWLSGKYSKRNIARSYGVQPETVNVAINGVTWAHIPMPPEFIRNEWLKGYGKGMRASASTSGISDNDAFFIKEMFASGIYKPKQIADLFKISKWVVWQITGRQRWKHIPDPSDMPKKRRRGTNGVHVVTVT